MSELNLRRWLKVQHPSALWVEAASGSSFGVPDAYLMGVNGQAAWVELKLGRWAEYELIFGVRPAQRQVMRMLGRAGLVGGFMVALPDNEGALFLVPDETALDGRVKMFDGLPKHGCFFNLKRSEDSQNVLKRIILCWEFWKKSEI